MSDEVILSNWHTALMFISTKCFEKKQEEKVKRIINEEIGGSLKFLGTCFGKFDLIAEFYEKSAKVASYKACNVQEKASNVLQEKYPLLKYPICSSLVLGNEFIKNDEIEKNNTNELPIRFYSLFVPKFFSFNLERVFKELRDNMRLLFSSSYFTFLLITSGHIFYKVFADFSKFRENTRDFFGESSTYVAIDWDEKDKPFENKKIQANMFLRLKDGFGDIDDLRIDDFVKSKNKRFGSFDISLVIEKDTLWEMKQEILSMRKKYKDTISYTSTSLVI